MTNTPTFPTSGVLAPGIYLDEIDPGSPKIPSVTRGRLRAALKRICDGELTCFVYQENPVTNRAQLRVALHRSLETCWAHGLLKGRSAEEAFFIRWDDAAPWQAELDDWFLICTVGMAPVHPWEFVVFRMLIRLASKP